MKTSEQRAKELLSIADNISLFEATLEEMRLEAWKQGMTDALEYVESGGYQATAIELRGIRDNKK